MIDIGVLKGTISFMTWTLTTTMDLVFDFLFLYVFTLLQRTAVAIVHGASMSCVPFWNFP